MTLFSKTSSVRPASRERAGHLKNLYNDYVYFWRWALWKVFERKEGPGVISFITASSYLRGPGFVGMREAMRRTFDELWIVDLEGDNLGARKTENVFNIQTPVAIATGIRYGEPKPDEPARVHYSKIEGNRAEKLIRLDAVRGFDSLDWKPCMQDWQKPMLPEGEGDYFAWPLLEDVFPWQQAGCMAGRTWPIAETEDTLIRRWFRLTNSELTERKQLFKDSPTGKKTGGPVSMKLLPKPASRNAIRDLTTDDPIPQVSRYAFRTFDQQKIFADNRLLDRAGPPLWRAHGPDQIYLTSMITKVLGLGPAATVSGELPDRDHFSGRGGKDVIPLWRDAATTVPNVTGGLLDTLSAQYGETVAPEDLFAYAYAVLGSPAYTESFAEELSIPGPRLPITKSNALFRRAVKLGRRLVGLHTYGERFGGSVPRGTARIEKAIPDIPQGYPEDYSYDPAEKTLKVGEGEIRPVQPEVYNYNVSGLEVVKSWLGYRKKNPTGRKSSPLDDIRPERWTGDMTRELLELLWVLEATVEKEPELAELLAEITSSEVFTADELPKPPEEERKPPKLEAGTIQGKLI